jgi:hypothetical protein
MRPADFLLSWFFGICEWQYFLRLPRKMNPATMENLLETGQAPW